MHGLSVTRQANCGIASKLVYLRRSEAANAKTPRCLQDVGILSLVNSTFVGIFRRAFLVSFEIHGISIATKIYFFFPRFDRFDRQHPFPARWSHYRVNYLIGRKPSRDFIAADILKLKRHGYPEAENLPFLRFRSEFWDRLNWRDSTRSKFDAATVSKSKDTKIILTRTECLNGPVPSHSFSPSVTCARRVRGLAGSRVRIFRGNSKTDLPFRQN